MRAAHRICTLKTAYMEIEKDQDQYLIKTSEVIAEAIIEANQFEENESKKCLLANAGNAMPT